jgi:glycine C-acetyltransferase
MRGDAAPLAGIVELARRFDDRFPENVVVIVDDSHGVGAYGPTGRGTEEQLGVPGQSDVLIGTLGKAFGVNGGYVVGPQVLVDFLRESAPTYIYSNPITPAEAAAALAAVELLDGPAGAGLISDLRAVTKRYRDGLVALGYETLPGEHPIDAALRPRHAEAVALVKHLRAHGVLATGLNFPGGAERRRDDPLPLSPTTPPADVDQVLGVPASFPAAEAQR